MPTFDPPVALNQGTYDLYFDYDIDPTHSENLKISIVSPPIYDQEDTVVIESLIAAISAHADWDFTLGFRAVPTAQQINP